jgi:hypothetical protein
MAENTPTLEHANMVYRALMVPWHKGEMTEAEFINATAVNLGKFIGWMKYDPEEYIALVLVSAAIWREDSTMPEERNA